MKIKDKISTFIFYLSIFLFIFAFNFQHNPPSGWYQQFLPSLPNMQVSDIFFLDSLNGWMVTGNGEPNDTSGYILKTTNGGDNWDLKFTDFRDFSRVKFLNENTGFASGQFGNGARLYKTTNAGENWFTINIPGGGQVYFNDLAVINEDTIWYVSQDALIGGLFRTTNGGMNWTQQYSAGSNNPRKIYMYDANTGFMSANVSNNLLLKTTNSGMNWVTISGENGFNDIHFINNLTGWKTSVSGGIMKKTTNGGFNWVTQILQSGGFIQNSFISKFSVLNADTIWGTGGFVLFPNNEARPILHRTTNGGDNWEYQIPDTTIHMSSVYFIDFINSKCGWAYGTSLTGIHTKVGGDTTFLSINPISNEIPANFQLEQNYPNPFNPATNIRFKIKSSDFVKLSVYDITGKEISVLVKGKLSAGEYEYAFDGSKLTSGVYFYRLQIEDYSDTKKMLLVK